MRDIHRIAQITEAFRSHWERNPDLRFGQIISNIISWSTFSEDIFYMEDDEFYEAMLKFFYTIERDKHNG